MSTYYYLLQLFNCKYIFCWIWCNFRNCLVVVPLILIIISKQNISPVLTAHVFSVEFWFYVLQPKYQKSNTSWTLKLILLQQHYSIVHTVQVCLVNNALMSGKSCNDTVFIDRNIQNHSKQTDYSKERAHRRLWAGYLGAGISLTCGLKQANCWREVVRFKWLKKGPKWLTHNDRNFGDTIILSKAN